MTDNNHPNILLIMSDQHHPGFLGCAGHSLVETPHIDGIASRGTFFKNAYCGSPLCCPSRMSFLTGRYPSEINCLTNHDQLDSDIPTFAHAFGAADYDTLLCGRMHFNGPDQRHGFHERRTGDVFWPQLHGHPEPRKILGELWGTNGPGINAIRKSGKGKCAYLAHDEHVTDAAVEWLEERSNINRPFMMTVGLVEPHAPFVAYPEDYDRYNDAITVEDLPAPHPERLHPELARFNRRAGLDNPEDPLSPEDQRRARVAYHGMCTFVDRQVGRMLQALEDLGLDDNTIVIYTSDHGEQIGEHGMWWKHTFYEASVGVPLVMAGPGIPAGKTAHQNVSLMDIGPSLVDLCGAPEIPGATGRSFRCLLDGKGEAWPDLVMSENLWSPASPHVHRMVRKGEWKLNLYPEHDSQLFHLKEDAGENRDRIADPECQEVIVDLVKETERLPDMASVVAGLEQKNAARDMVSNALRKSDLPEPDAPWFDPENLPENVIFTDAC
jgi:choline-sulfatase